MTSPRRVPPSQVAELLGVSTRKVQEMCATGDLPAIKIGAAWRISLADVSDLMRRTSNAPRPKCQTRISMSVTGSIGRESRSTDASIAKAYAQLLGRKRASA